MMDHNVRMANTVTISLAMYEGIRKQIEEQQKIIKELSNNIEKISVTYNYQNLITGLSPQTFSYEGKDEVIKRLLKEKEAIQRRADNLTHYLATKASRRQRRRFITKGEIFESWLI